MYKNKVLYHLFMIFFHIKEVMILKEVREANSPHNELKESLISLEMSILKTFSEME